MARIIPITDFSAPELDVYARLTENQLVSRRDPSEAMFIAESPVVIERALDGGCVPVSFLMEDKHVTGRGAALIARCGDVPVYCAPEAVLCRLTGFHLTRGMLCAMRRPARPAVEEVCRGASRIAVLENVMNPTNIGAIFRSAAALVATAAMALRADSLRLDAPELRACEKLAVVLGTEGDGLAAQTIAACDYTVMIPMAHGVDSLNVAAASAVAFWELGKR